MHLAGFNGKQKTHTYWKWQFITVDFNKYVSSILALVLDYLKITLTKITLLEDCLYVN